MVGVAVVGATVVGAAVVGVDVGGTGGTVGCAVVGTAVVGCPDVGATVVGAAVVGAAVDGAAVDGCAVGATFGAKVMATSSLRCGMHQHAPLGAVWWKSSGDMCFSHSLFQLCHSMPKQRGSLVHAAWHER